MCGFRNESKEINNSHIELLSLIPNPLFYTLVIWGLGLGFSSAR